MGRRTADKDYQSAGRLKEDNVMPMKDIKRLIRDMRAKAA